MITPEKHMKNLRSETRLPETEDCSRPGSCRQKGDRQRDFRQIILSSIILVSLCWGTLATADVVYVRDTLYVPLRGGQSSEHRILHRGLQSGTRLERMEDNTETGYSRVITSGGIEGWIQTQYLVEAPIAATQLEDTLAKLRALDAEYQQTLLRLREVSDAETTLADTTGALQKENEELTAKLTEITDLAANVLDIDKENKSLVRAQRSLDEEIDRLLTQNAELRNDSAQQWFLRGGGTVLLGLLFGFWFGRRIYHRRNSGWD